MNQALRRDQIIRDLESVSSGSFALIQRALAEVAAETGSNQLDLEAVKARIRKLMAELPEDTPSEAAE